MGDFNETDGQDELPGQFSLRIGFSQSRVSVPATFFQSASFTTTIAMIV